MKTIIPAEAEAKIRNLIAKHEGLKSPSWDTILQNIEFAARTYGARLFDISTKDRGKKVAILVIRRKDGGVTVGVGVADLSPRKSKIDFSTVWPELGPWSMSRWESREEPTSGLAERLHEWAMTEAEDRVYIPRMGISFKNENS